MNHNTRRGISCPRVLAIAVLFAGACVSAEDAAPSAPPQPEVYETIAVDAPAPPSEPASAPPTSQSRLVGEIVVTAQKREELLQDVPISISAFSTAQLEAQGVLDVEDLPKITPGLTVTTQVGFTSTFLRGVGSDAFLLADPSVAIYVDEVYFPFVLGVAQDFGTIDRVEVLKGPQGTLFGRNSLGGAIRIITRDPSLEAPEVSLQAIFGERNTRNTRAYFSLPLTDALAVSVAGYYNIQDPVADGVWGFDDSSLPRERANGVRGKLLWRPADWMEARIAHYDFDQDAVGSLYAPNTSPSLITTLAGEQPQDPYHGKVDAEPVFDIHNKTTFGRLQFMPGWMDVKLFGSHQKIHNRQATDFDGTPTPMATFQGNTASKVKTAELQFISNGDSPGAEWLEWIVGGFWFKSEGGITANLFAGGTNFNDGMVFGVPVPTEFLDLFDDPASGLPFPGGQVNAAGQLATRSIAYYTQATAHLGERVELTLGGRYQDEERDLLDSTARLLNLDGSYVVIADYGSDTDPSFVDTTRSFDPKVSLAFHPGWAWLGDDPMLYASWQVATKSSTYNIINLTDAPERVKAEEITAYEVGFKSLLFDGLMRLQAAAFLYDINNPQVQVVSLLNGGSVSFENAGGERIEGFDFDALIQLLPSLTDGLVLTLSGAVLDTEYTAYRDGSGFDSTTGVFSSGNDYTGNEVVRSPEYSGTAGLSQTFRTPYGPLEIGASYYYNSGFFYLAQATPNVEEKAYGTLGASISFLYERWNLRVTAFGRNLTDERYNVGRFITDFGSNDAVAERSFLGLRLNIDY